MLTPRSTLWLLLQSLTLVACGSASAGLQTRTIELNRWTWPIAGEHNQVVAAQRATAVYFTVSSYAMCQVIVKEAVEERASDGTVHQGEPQHRQEGQLQRCNERPIRGPVEVSLRTHGVCHKLGMTAADGQLAVRLETLDAILSEETVAAGDIGQLLVDGKEVGELPLQPIAMRAEKTESSIAACGQLLAAAQPDEEQFEDVLSELFTLHLHGVMDARIDDCRKQLVSRLHRSEVEAARYQAELERAQAVFAGLQNAGSAMTVPPRVRKNVESKRPPDNQTLDWAVKNLPRPERELCAGLAKGVGAVTGFLVTKGAAGLAVAIVSAVWGEQLQSWFVDRCAGAGQTS